MTEIHPLLQPYEPSEDDPFDSVKAAHLLNRAGFGGTPEEIEKVQKMGPQKAADWLLDFPDAPAEEMSEKDVPDLSGHRDYPERFSQHSAGNGGENRRREKAIRQMQMMANRDAIIATVDWWMRRMTYGSTPLHEKLTLFLARAFCHQAPRMSGQRSLMWKQNELLRHQRRRKFPHVCSGHQPRPGHARLPKQQPEPQSRIRMKIMRGN